MDIAKIFTAICSLVLIVCLVLSVTTLTVLRNAIDENGQVQEEAKRLIGELDQSLDRLELAVNAEAKDEEEIPTNATSTDTYVVRSCNGRIAVYTSSGSMLYWIDVNVDLLPEADREALSKGIELESLSQLKAFLNDYTS